MTHEMPDPADSEPKHWAFTKAVCLDLPYILDSVWRRAEFNLNRLVRYEVDVGTPAAAHVTVTRRRYTHVLPFWFFLVSLIFVAYGPTFDAWCSVVGPAGMRYSRAILGALCVLAALCAWIILIIYGEHRAQKRLLKAKVAKEERCRRFWVRAGVQAAVVCVAGIFAWFGVYLFNSRLNTDVCRAGLPGHPFPLARIAPSHSARRHHRTRIFLEPASTRRSADRLHEQVALLLGMVLALWVFIVPDWDPARPISHPMCTRMRSSPARWPSSPAAPAPLPAGNSAA